MIRVALRLAVVGGRDSAARLVVTILGMALGVAVLFFVASFEPALAARGWRAAQRNASHQPTAAEVRDGDTLMVVDRGLYFDTEITFVHLAAGGVNAPTPPGLPRLPGQGETFVSPALADLLTTPAGEMLRPRVPGDVAAASVTGEALTHPNELVAWVGWRPQALLARSAAAAVSAFPLPPPSNEWWTSKLPVRVGITVLLVSVLLPVMIFVGVLARLGAAERDQRLATLRLLGATPTQTHAVAAVEAVVVTALAVALGSALFLAIRPLAARVSLGGYPWFPTDFAPPVGALVAVMVGVPAVAALTSTLTLRRVMSSPLAATASGKRPARSVGIPSALLVTGLTGLLTTRLLGRDTHSGAFTTLAAVSVLLIVLALPALGPWLVSAASAVLARTARGAPTLLAARRSASDPRGAFRASSGLMVGMFIATMIYGYTTGNLGSVGSSWSEGDADVIIETGDHGRGRVFDEALRELQHLAGVNRVLALRRASVDGSILVVADCKNVASFRLARLNPCPGRTMFVDEGDPVAGMLGSEVKVWAGTDARTQPVLRIRLPSKAGALQTDSEFCCLGNDALLEAGGLPGHFVASLPARLVMLDTDGHPETLERIRNVVAPRLPGADVVTPATQAARWHAALADARRIVTLALVVTVAVAGASLTAATLGRLLERRRALTLLRAMGVPVKVIFISVLVEATVPLVLSVTVGAAFGMLTAAALVAALGGNSAQPLVAIGLLVVGSLLAGLSLVAATFPIIVRATSPHSLRTT